MCSAIGTNASMSPNVETPTAVTSSGSAQRLMPNRPSRPADVTERSGADLFAVPVVELGLVADETDVALRPRPDPELAAVRIRDDRERRLRREDEEARNLLVSI